MEAFRAIEKPDYRKYRLLRECLVDVRALVADDASTGAPPAAANATPARAPAPKPDAGLRLDGIANAVVLCIGVAVVVVAATEGLHATLWNLA